MNIQFDPSKQKFTMPQSIEKQLLHPTTVSKSDFVHKAKEWTAKMASSAWESAVSTAGPVGLIPFTIIGKTAELAGRTLELARKQGMYSTKTDTIENREYLNLQGQFDKSVRNLDNHRTSMTTEAYNTALGELRTKFNTAMQELETKQEKVRPDREKAMGSVMASLTGFATKTFQLVAREREAIFPKSETKK